MPKPPDFSQLRAFVFCRQIEFTSDGHDLSGIHNLRFARTFPVEFDELQLYASFATEEAGPHRVQLWWRHNDAVPVIRDEQIVDVDETRFVAIRMHCREFLFPAPGVYAFALYCEGALLGTTTLEIYLMEATASA